MINKLKIDFIKAVEKPFSGDIKKYNKLFKNSKNGLYRDFKKDRKT